MPASDAALVRRIFALQAVGNMMEADRLSGLLADTTLVPALQADRCLRLGLACPALVQASFPPDGAMVPAAAPVGDAAAVFRADRSSSAAARVRRLWENHRDVAAAAMAATVPDDAEAGLLGGLAAWRHGDLPRAAALFEAAASQPAAGSATLAAADFWSARARRRQGDLPGAMAWLRTGARYTGCFYGILSRRLLAAGGELPSPDARLGAADLDLVISLPGGRRMLALVQVGQPDLAGAELRRLWPTLQSPEQRRAVQLTAVAAGLDRALAAMPDPAIALPASFGYSLAPAGGFILDPALVYGLVAVESNFKTDTVSHAGARGLMQLMPTTAANFAGRDGPSSLSNASLNLMIGQRYLAYLAEKRVNHDLVRMLVSYNAGPGYDATLNQALGGQTDPLLYIEAITRTETRQFVQKVLTQSWLFAARLNRPTPTLDALAAGRFPSLGE